MNTLTIELKNKRHFDAIVEIDGEIVDMKRTKNQSKMATYSTEKDVINLKVYTIKNELVSRFWFLRFLLYYIVSILGIFDWHYNSNGYSLMYEANYALCGDGYIDLRWNNVDKKVVGGKALYSTQDYFDDNDTNIYQYDKRVKRRYKGLLAFKILSWIGILITIILLKVI